MWAPVVAALVFERSVAYAAASWLAWPRSGSESGRAARMLYVSRLRHATRSGRAAPRACRPGCGFESCVTKAQLNGQASIAPRMTAARLRETLAVVGACLHG